MSHSLFRWSVALVLLLTFATPFAWAQGGAASTLSGVVTDSSDAVITGAVVTVKHDATGTEFRAVSDGNGAFTIPAVPPVGTRSRSPCRASRPRS